MGDLFIYFSTDYIIIISIRAVIICILFLKPRFFFATSCMSQGMRLRAGGWCRDRGECGAGHPKPKLPQRRGAGAVGQQPGRGQHLHVRG